MRLLAGVIHIVVILAMQLWRQFTHVLVHEAIVARAAGLLRERCIACGDWAHVRPLAGVRALVRSAGAHRLEPLSAAGERACIRALVRVDALMNAQIIPPFEL